MIYLNNLSEIYLIYSEIYLNYLDHRAAGVIYLFII